MNQTKTVLTSLCSGYLFFTGAYAVAAHPTPDMLAYAMSKAAVANLAANLSKTERSGLPATAQVALLLP